MKEAVQAPERTGRLQGMRWGWATLALGLVYGVLALPNHPAAMLPGALAVFPFELLAIVALLLATAPTPRLSWLVRLAILVALLTSIVVKAADLALFTALNRPFNFAYDLPLVGAAWMLLSGTSGTVAAVVYVAVILAALSALAWLLWSALAAVARTVLPRKLLISLTLLVLAPFLLALRTGNLPVSSLTTRILAEHVAAAGGAYRDSAALLAEAGNDPFVDVPPADMLAALKGKDIILAFVESYGRSSLDNPLYAATTAAALSTVETELRASGLSARSAWLTSPTFGGQSWLAHATLLSGLWVDTQGRYGALIGSSRKTLNRLAVEAGWRSVAVMPAITMPWPEAGYYGYSRVLAAQDLGYRGLPFNWVTMPDQFTLASFDRLELGAAPRPPIFAELALISSHAPWTPIPELVPWAEIGDGSIFDAQARRGELPEAVWASNDRVRDQFRQSIDYALRTIGEFAVRQASRAPLIIILGDHQPAAFVSGTETNRDVPIHVISDDETIRMLDGWGWTNGMQPDARSPVWRMDSFRDAFLDAFSTASEPRRDKDPSA